MGGRRPLCLLFWSLDGLVVVPEAMSKIAQQVKQDEFEHVTLEIEFGKDDCRLRKVAMRSCHNGRLAYKKGRCKMKRKLWIPGIFLGVIALLVSISVLFVSLPTERALAQNESQQLRTIEVSGVGQVEVAPDKAVVRLGVQTEADTAEAALTENSEKMTAVISATVEMGIEEADIQTQGLSLQPIYASTSESTPNTNSPELTGYRAQNVVQITVNDLSQLGELLDTAVSVGGNTIDGIQFEVSDRTARETEARAAAMQDAQQKAEQLAQLAGAELGLVHTIRETGSTSPVITPYTREQSLAATVPIQPGAQSIQTSVQVVWEIE